MYITYLEYTQLGDQMLPEFDFLKYEYEAERILDDVTTTVDGVSKLQTAFPTREEDKRAVTLCMAALIAKMADIDRNKAKIQATETGAEGGIIKAKSSGAESITYETGLVVEAIQTAADETKRQQALRYTAQNWLRGVKDANGINMLYGGPYNVL